jgi:DNA-binding MarR family transcriptional regulator
MTYAKDMPASAVTSPGVEIDHELVAALRIGVMRLARRLRLERSGSDLSLTQLSALGTLYNAGEITIGELANVERVKPPSMTRTINCLEDAGLVTRSAHASDGRQVVVNLTDDARAVLDADRQRRDAWLAVHLAELDPADVDLLRRVAPLLDRMSKE